MPIVQGGTINTTALVNPGLYVQVVPPNVVTLNGVPTNKVGIVGTAVWGPVGTPTVCSGPTAAAANFGPLQNRKYDLGTPISTASLQGASNFLVVRATDGTDTAASVVVQTNCITWTGKYTGTLGNSISVNIATGSKGTGYYKLTVSIGVGITGMPQQPPEVFDNLAFGLTGAAIWAAFAAAINSGTSIQRGPSKIITATAGVGTTTPTPATATLSGGTDGASTATAVAATPSIIYGTDTSPRTGMYALRSSGCSILIVSDMDTSTAWTYVDAFAASEGMYAIQTGPAGDTLSNAPTTLLGVGLTASYSSKYMQGDWVYWQDGVNNIQRLVSPQGFIAGMLANLAPNQTSLNKPLAGVLGTQKSGVVGSAQLQSYAAADETTLVQAGICIIGNPSPGGSYWSDLVGHNVGLNPGTYSDSYTRMVNYVAATANAGMGQYVGQPITSQLLLNITGTLNQFFGNLLQQGLLTRNLADGSLPYNVVCNASNNPQSRTSLGYVQADCYVTLEGINEKFLVNLTMGATVITTQVSPIAAN
jgi:hypothetical protein